MAGPPPESWTTYSIESDGVSVNTGNWLGWIDIQTKPWIFSYQLDTFMYLPEAGVEETGAWSYIPK